MDARKALSPGTTLKLRTHTGYTVYSVRREIGRGGSCIVYDASSTDNLGNDKLVRIKECYPHALRICRSEDGTLHADERDSAAFEAAKRRLIEAYQTNHTLFAAEELTNTVANTSNLYEENGTVYIVSTWLNGQTLADAQIDSLHDCIALMLSSAKVLKSIHDTGYLYLDLKPENILTIRGSLDLVQLFDFDSMIAMSDMEVAIQSDAPTMLRTSYTRGYAALEQRTGNLRQIGKHSDLYSLGAVLFHTLWGRTPSAFDCEENAKYDFDRMVYPAEHYQGRLFRELTVFFHHTLASYHKDRYQDAAEAIEQLKILLALADETRPWIRSTVIPQTGAFFGREAEMDALNKLLHETELSPVNLYGMGGIGKSTTVRTYLNEHMDGWDAVLWLYAQDDLQYLIADDLQVALNTVHRMADESTEEYAQRKLTALSSLAAEQRILLVMDNFTSEQLNQAEQLAQVGWKKKKFKLK